jgi:hypothetical protein
MPLRNPLELFDRNSGAKFLMSAPKPKQREVRSGSNSEVAGLEQDVRSTLKNRHRHAGPACPKSANSGHRQSVSMRARPQYAAAGRLGSVNDASKGVHCWCQKIILMLVPE